MLHLYYHALVYKGLVDVYLENTCLSPNAGIILARVVDSGPTLNQHWSFVKGESCLLTLSALAALKRYL